MQKLSGGQAAVNSLKAESVRHVFGLIGSATMEMFDALYDESGIDFFGVHDEHLLQIEQLLDVRLRYRGNSLEISGPETSREIADRVILSLYTRLKNDLEISEG